MRAPPFSRGRAMIFASDCSNDGPIQTIKSAPSSCLTCDGFNCAACGDWPAGMRRCGAPTPRMRFAVNECNGKIETTTSGAARAGDASASAADNNAN